MHRDPNDRRRAAVRWAAWLTAAAVAALLAVRVLDDDVVEVFDTAITALRVAEAALDDAVADIGAAAAAQRGQNAGSAPPGGMTAAAQLAESAARAAARAGNQTRAVLTRVRHMRMERSGTFAEAVEIARGLRDATRALMAAVEALRAGAEALRDAGALRAAHRALLAADATLDAAQTVLQATETALDDERLDAPPAADSVGGSVAAQRAVPHVPHSRCVARDAGYCCPPPAASRSSARAPLSTLVRL